jgi:hypothetical protein
MEGLTQYLMYYPDPEATPLLREGIDAQSVLDYANLTLGEREINGED